jgi:hypothetical protein
MHQRRKFGKLVQAGQGMTEMQPGQIIPVVRILELLQSPFPNKTGRDAGPN